MAITKSELNKMTTDQKKGVVLDLYMEAMFLDEEISDRFDIESDKMLDKKIEVLQRIIDGEKPDNIPEYEDILEIMN